MSLRTLVSVLFFIFNKIVNLTHLDKKLEIL